MAPHWSVFTIRLRKGQGCKQWQPAQTSRTVGSPHLFQGRQPDTGIAIQYKSGNKEKRPMTVKSKIRILFCYYLSLTISFTQKSMVVVAFGGLLFRLRSWTRTPRQTRERGVHCQVHFRKWGGGAHQPRERAAELFEGRERRTFSFDIYSRQSRKQAGTGALQSLLTHKSEWSQQQAGVKLHELLPHTFHEYRWSPALWRVTDA